MNQRNMQTLRCAVRRVGPHREQKLIDRMGGPGLFSTQPANQGSVEEYSDGLLKWWRIDGKQIPAWALAAPPRGCCVLTQFGLL